MAGVVRMGVVELVVSMRTRSGEHIMAAICRPHTFDPSILLANASTKIFFPLSTYSPLVPSSKSITPAQTSLVSEFASGMNTARAVVCISLKGPMAVIGVMRCLLCGLFPRRSCL